MELLRAQNLSFCYASADGVKRPEEKPIIENVSFSIEEGSFVLLVGPTGCGKTTLLRLIKKELAPHGEMTGELLYRGKKLEHSSQIGYVMQNPEHQCVTDKVWHELAFGLENRNTPYDEMRFRCGEMAAYFGMEEWLEKEVDALSGGQKQKMNLASVLVMQPELIILDEPTSQLDPIAADEFIAMLKRLNEETGITVLIAEHRLERLMAYADRLLLMENGHLCYEGEPRRLREQDVVPAIRKALPCGMQIGLAMKSETLPVTVSETRSFLGECCGRMKSVSKEIPCRHVGEGEPPALAGAYGIPGDEKQEALIWKDVSFRYQRRDADVLRHFRLTLHRGEIVCLMGSNGSGKTTALKCAAGILRPYGGAVRAMLPMQDGGRVRKRRGSEGDLFASVAYLPQDVETVFLYDSVDEELLRIPEEVLKSYPFDLENLRGKHPYDLSGGEKQMLALAVVLGNGKDILLLDEPAKGLDAASRERLIAFLSYLRTEGKGILVVTHDVEFAASCGDYLGFVSCGEVVSLAPVREFFRRHLFYATQASKIARGFYEDIVTTEELIECVSGIS